MLFIIDINVFGRHFAFQVTSITILEEFFMFVRIPRGEDALIGYGANIHRCNIEYAEKLGLDADEINTLQDYFLKFRTLHDQCANNEQPKTVTRQKDEAVADYLKELRRFIRELQANSNMTDPIRADYNITISSGRKSKIGAPSGEVVLNLSYEGGLHKVIVKIAALTDTADARADYGVAIYRGLMPHGGATLEQAAGAKHYLMKAPISGDELLYYRFTRKKKEVVVFDPDDAGMTAYFCARYENQKGDVGEWGPVVWIIAP
jgi:hypothetical protein